MSYSFILQRHFVLESLLYSMNSNVKFCIALVFINTTHTNLASSVFVHQANIS